MSDPRIRPAEAHASVFKLAQLGLAYLRGQDEADLSPEQRQLRERGSRALMYFDRTRENAERISRTHCSHCSRQGFTTRDDYMVREAVWKVAHPEGYKGLLHLSCLQDRLGRLLTVADFSYNMCFTNRHLHGIGTAEWEKRTGVPLTPGLAVKIATQDRKATGADRAYIEAIRDRG